MNKKNKSLNKSLVATLLLIASSWQLVSCDSKSTGKGDVKFTQYFIKGEQLYLSKCSNCHQKDGAGLGTLYPPLKESDFLHKKNEVICLIKNGKTGSIVVNGTTYTQEMPAMPTLTNLEIAELATYIYNTWSTPQTGLIDIKQVSEILEKCN